MRCPHCGDDRQTERTAKGWFCNTCGKEFPQVPTKPDLWFMRCDECAWHTVRLSENTRRGCLRCGAPVLRLCAPERVMRARAARVNALAQGARDARIEALAHAERLRRESGLTGIDPWGITCTWPDDDSEFTLSTVDTWYAESTALFRAGALRNGTISH